MGGWQHLGPSGLDGVIVYGAKVGKKPEGFDMHGVIEYDRRSAAGTREKNYREAALNSYPIITAWDFDLALPSIMGGDKSSLRKIKTGYCESGAW